MKKLLTTHTVRLLLAFLCLVGSFTLMDAQPTNFALVGAGEALGDWDTSNPKLFTYNNSDKTYTLALTDVASNASFKLSGRSDNNFSGWGNFNAGVFHNSNLISGDNTLNFEGQDKGNMTMPVSGNVTLTISNVTSSSLTLKISGVVTPDVYSVVGQPTEIFGGTVTWANDNDMTESNDVWTWTSGQFTNVSDIQFKVRKNHDWGSSWGGSGPGGNYQLTPDASKSYTLTVTFDGSSITSATLNEIVSYPDIYLHHWKTDINSSTDVAEKMTGSNGSYSITLNLDKDEYLLFTDYSAHSWTTNRYNPSAQDVLSGLTTANATANGTAGVNTSVVFKTYAEGNYTFTFNFSTKAWTAKLNSVVTPDPAYYFISENEDWDAANKVAFTNNSGTFTLTRTFNGSFKIIDENGNWLACSGGKTLTRSSNTVRLASSGQGENLYLPTELNYTLTIANGELTVTFPAATYTVAGTPASVFGAEWDKARTANDMTLSSGVYTKTFSNIVYPSSGSFEFKVFEDHNDAQTYPASNYAIDDGEAGYTYNLTITYDPSDNDVSHELELVSATNKTWYLTNNFGGNWDTNNSGAQMTANSTNTVYTWTYNFTSLTNDVKYFVLADALISDGWSDNDWKNNHVYAGSTSDDTEIIPVPAGASAQLVKCAKSFKLPKGLKGTYTFTYDVANKTMTVAGAAPFEVKDWYLLSQFDTGSWQLNNSSDKFTYDEETGNYVLRKTISTNKNTHFLLSQKVANSAEGWSDIAGFRYHPASDTEASLSTALSFGQNSNGSWYLPWGYIGTYTFTINAAGTQLTITGPARASRDTGKMYIIGNANAGVWQANHGVEMTETATGSGIFVADNVQLMSGSDFSFTSKLGINDTDWATVNLYRYYAVSDQTCEVFDNMVGNVQTSTAGTEFSLQDTGDGSGNTNNFKMKTSGSYRITLNTTTTPPTVMFQQMYNDLYMFGKGFHWGNQTPNAWDPTSAIQMTTTDGKIYHLDAVTFDEGDAVGFIFSNVVADNNDDGGRQYVAKNGFFPSNSDSYAIRKDDTQNDINEQLTMVAGSTDNTEALANFNQHRWFVWGEVARSGKYNVVVDIENKTVMLKENITINNEMYIRLEQTSNVTRPGVKVWIEGGTITKFNGEWANGAEGTHMTGDTNPGNVTSQDKTYWLDGKTWFKCREYTSYDNRKWWEWEIGGDQFRIASITFYRNGDENDNPDDPNGDLNRRSGVLYYTWPNTDDIEDHTADYYIDHVKEAPDCATMIDDHYYVYFVNTPGWSTVYCHAWNSNNEALLPDAGNGTASGSWPGAQCMVVGYTDDGFAVYRYDFGLKSYWQNMDVAGIIFNSGENEQGVVGEQTGDFPFKNGGVFDYVGRVSLGRSLGTIIAKGVVNGPLYEVEDELTIVYYDPYESGSYTVPIYEDGEQVGTTTTNYTGAFYAKDNNTANSKSLNTSGKRDYVFMTHFKGEKDNVNYELLMPGRTRYDQSNWVKLVRANDYASTTTNANWNAATLVGKKIAGDNLGGQLVDNLNPTMIVETLPANALSAASYTKNDYIMPHFNDNYTVDGTGDFFFVQPKPQEVAHITWAVYNAANDAFYVPAKGVELNHDAYDDLYYGMFLSGNNFDLKGGIKVASWDLAGQDETAIRGRLRDKQAYQFNAIIRYKDNTATPAPHSRLKAPAESNYDTTFNPANSIYEVYPVEINVNDWIVTGINDISDSSIKEVKSVKVYDTMGVERREMQGGVNIVVTTYSDGTRSVQKILK